MRSSSGAYYLALDHLRGVAVFMVFVWHFIHVSGAVPTGGTPPVFPLALLDQGYTGVALFMVLSGYLFAKLLDGRSIDYAAFLWNRALRLLPLLVIVCALAALAELSAEGNIWRVLGKIETGWFAPSLPNGGWSVTVEAHFYVLLPLILLVVRKWSWAPLGVIVAMLAIRTVILAAHGDIHGLAYFTLIGRIDQFLFGILMWRYRGLVTRRHVLVAAIVAAFATFYWLFDLSGGYSATGNDWLWIVIPTIEGVVYAILVAYYDTSFAFTGKGPLSRVLAAVGRYSYSIYLLHPFLTDIVPGLIEDEVMDISNFYVATAWAILVFPFSVLLGGLSYRFIELPFLSLRRAYIRGTRVSGPDPVAATSGLLAAKR